MFDLFVILLSLTSLFQVSFLISVVDDINIDVM